jgi:hypothetical protein
MGYKKSLTALAACVLFGYGLQAKAESKFGEFSTIIGCGTVTSVRKLNQAPLYDKVYENDRQDRAGSTGDVAGVLAGFGIVGAAVGFVGGLAADTAIAANVKTKAPVAPAGGEWKTVKAIRIKFDDGREVNLPLYEGTDSIINAFHYKEGQRLTLTYSKELDNIQPFMKGVSIPPPSEDYKYINRCKLRADKAVADDIIERSKNLVDESKIIPE